jgi:RNA polymerase sigma-70 factor (sigma-E family)
MQPGGRAASLYRHENEERTGVKRNEDDFRVFVADRLERWRRSAYLLCQDWHTADDVVSGMLGKLYRNWRKVSRLENPDAYAQRILTRTWLDERKRPWNNREQVHQTLPEVATDAPEHVTDRQQLAALLRSLGPKQRAVVVLRFYLDYSVEETAKILNISVGTVKSQSARGLTNLRANAASAN